MQQDDYGLPELGASLSARSLPSLAAARRCNETSTLRRLLISLPLAVECDAQALASLQHITSVSISGAFPTGLIAALCTMPQLIGLDLRQGDLSVADGEQLSGAPRLQKLSLCAVSLSKDFMRSLAASTSLTRLSLAGCGLRLSDLDPLVLYNQSLVRISFFSLEPTSALGYHLVDMHALAVGRTRDFVAKLIILARSRCTEGATRSHSRLCALPTDLLVLIMAAVPAPPMAKYPSQVAACARFVLTTKPPAVLLQSRHVMKERKTGPWWTLAAPSFAWEATK